MKQVGIGVEPGQVVEIRIDVDGLTIRTGYGVTLGRFSPDHILAGLVGDLPPQIFYLVGRDR